jgi:2-polyprenyl-3-methyl-5-hydroxy-6-metoxy-1,4-benzoquinol methylase
MKEPIAWNTYIASYLWGTILETRSSKYNPTLEVWLINGKKILNAARANYSYGSLHKVFQKTFRSIKLKNKKPQSILVLGFGAGSIASIVYDELKLNCKITGIEIDATIIELAKRHFDINRFENLNVHCEAAEEFVQHCTDKYDVICVDIFNDMTVPASIETESFLMSLKNCLNPKGTLVFNKIVDSKNKQKTFLDLKEKISKVFGNLDVIRLNGTNRVLLAINT